MCIRDRYLARQVRNMRHEDVSVVAKAALELKGMSDDLPGAGKNAGMISNDRKNMAKNGAISTAVVLMLNTEDDNTRMHCSKILRNLSCEPTLIDQMIESSLTDKLVAELVAAPEGAGFSVKKTAGIDPLKKMHVNLKHLFENLSEEVEYDLASNRYFRPSEGRPVAAAAEVTAVGGVYLHHWSTDPYQRN
eukprot:TRINITY_DN18873_c0_g1_i2.p1 TRINITY_DN18873_c0_g1~~TRINITY_DN18873_c0_g1_i2.p1  ORF type:complete len:191 (-),score=61.90 TRINITY_DN18873_c0_g1_i2:232-804(-)